MKKDRLSVTYAVLSRRIGKGFNEVGEQFDRRHSKEVLKSRREKNARYLEEVRVGSLKTLGWAGCWLDRSARAQDIHFLLRTALHPSSVFLFRDVTLKLKIIY